MMMEHQHTKVTADLSERLKNLEHLLIVQKVSTTVLPARMCSELLVDFSQESSGPNVTDDIITVAPGDNGTKVKADLSKRLKSLEHSLTMQKDSTTVLPARMCSEPLVDFSRESSAPNVTDNIITVAPGDNGSVSGSESNKVIAAITANYPRVGLAKHI